MIPSVKKFTRNNVLNRFLPITESVVKNLESEPKITDFNLIKELGSGSFGRVLLVQHKLTQAKYAIKAIDKRNAANIQEKPYFRREIEIMYRVHHPNVVKLFGHFEDNTYCYFLMEYIPGGNIYSLVPKNGIAKTSIKNIASIMKDVICATYFLHSMNPPIIHRDIKPENVVLDQNMRAKLTDFGWSNYIIGDMKRTTVCGTPVYLAPEIINNTGHDGRVDIWCIGALLFELMTGYAPFEGNNVQTIKYNISRMKIKWPRNMDRDAADLISKILKYNPNERITLQQMLLHPFITKFFPDAINSLKRPDNTQYRIFIMSKDNPLTWNPIFSGNDISLKLKPYNNDYNTLNKYNYNNLLQKYNDLRTEYNELKNVGFSNSELNNLRKELQEKEEKINQLSKTQYNKFKNNNGLLVTYNELANENYDLKNILNYYETQYNQQNNMIYLDNDFNNIRNLISNNNKNGFNHAVKRLQNNIDNYTKNNYTAIIMMKEQEMEKRKQEEKLRREIEQQQINEIINKYDKTLAMGEQQNQQLKMRLKELEGYFL